MTEITDDLPAILLREEHAGWKAILQGRGGEHYARAMTRDGLMIVPGAAIGRDDVARSFAGTVPWDAYEIHEPAIVRLGEHAGIVAYRAVATRGDETLEFRMSTTYLYGGGSWHVALHQQSPA